MENEKFYTFELMYFALGILDLISWLKIIFLLSSLLIFVFHSFWIKHFNMFLLLGFIIKVIKNLFRVNLLLNEMFRRRLRETWFWIISIKCLFCITILSILSKNVKENLIIYFYWIILQHEKKITWIIYFLILVWLSLVTLFSCFHFFMKIAHTQMKTRFY